MDADAGQLDEIIRSVGIDADSAFAKGLKEIVVVAGRDTRVWLGMVVQIRQTVDSVLRPIAEMAWMFDEEICLREYARRMNAGPWRWRRQSWRRLNRQQRLAARQWWYSYGRKAMKGA